MVPKVQATRTEISVTPLPKSSPCPAMQKKGIADTGVECLARYRNAQSSSPWSCLQDFFAAIARWFRSLFGSNSAEANPPVTVRPGAAAVATRSVWDTPEGTQILDLIRNKSYFIRDGLERALSNLAYPNLPRFAAVIIKIDGRIVATHYGNVAHDSRENFGEIAIQKMDRTLRNQEHLPLLLQGGRVSVNMFIVRKGLLRAISPYFHSFYDTARNAGDPPYTFGDLSSDRIADLLTEHCEGHLLNIAVKNELLMPLLSAL